MGELFLAAAGETGGFEKLCVVKKVLTELEDDGVRRRFLDEAKVVVRLNHANLVQVFDAGRVREEHYLAMELVEGKDLRAVWNRCAQLRRRIPVDFAIYVIRDLCRGLDYVHDAMSLDLVHRDISPPNIMVSYHGQTKITDFGLASHAIKRELTNPGVVFGRYSYLSPEQARGLPADRRTDIYATGIVLWEMLTGRQLFPAERHAAVGAAALRELRNPKIRAPSELVPGIPDGLDGVVLQALAVEREERFQTAGEFKRALSEVLNVRYSSSDVDSVAAFMRDIFAREFKLEAQDYASYAREDFSPIRAQAQLSPSESMSISDAIELDAAAARVARERSDALAAAAGQIGERAHPSGKIELEDEIDGRGRTDSGRAWNGGPSAKELAAAARERVGQVVNDRYRIDRLLGVGGMGAVYAVTHQDLGKTYALKVLHEIFSRDPELIERFKREARAATQTGHPNIIDVIDIGTVEVSGDVFFVMELLDGTDLGRVIRQTGPMAIRRTVHIARQICRALSAAHEAGIIHRDLKSENVVLSVKGGDPDFVKVLDFGICKQVDGSSTSQTTPGMVMGSPDYMAPEQAAGVPANVKSDIYALGTILFEMLTGTLPFVGRNAIDVLMRKGAGPAPAVNEMRPDVPATLAEVVARCLSRDLDERPESMTAVEYELTRALEGRASAVAAVMGLNLEGEGSEVSGSADSLRFESSENSNSLSEMLSRSSDNHPGSATGGPASSRESIITVHDQAAARSLAAESAVEPKAGWLKPAMWVGIGAVVVLLLVVLIRPELIPGLGDEARDEDGVETTAGEDAVPGEGDGSAPAEVDSGAEPEPPAEDDDEGETAGGDTGGARAPVDNSPEAIVSRAEQALEEEHWREPAEGSLAIELANLVIAEPGNEAIGRLRRDAEKILGPQARKAAKAKEWETAVSDYRDLLAIWPDHESSRENFLEALRALARDQRRSRDYEAMLATADELLVYEPKMFAALKYRADALAGLERWEEAAPAYRQAMRIRPSSKDAKKGYWRARSKLKNEE